jgi:hypothetical protein
MLPSFISSSDRPTTRGRNWGTFAAVILVILAAGELALRFPQVRALLPPRTHFYHPVIAQRLDAIERVTSEHGRVDVLFVGSSIVMTNVEPRTFDSEVAPEAGPLVSFNAGLPGIWPQSVHLYLENVWLPVARPRVVVQGIRYAELAATTHAKHESQVWTGRVEQGWREADLLTRLHAAAVERLHLLQYRGALIGALERHRDGWSGESQSEASDASRGYEARSANPDAEWVEDLPNEGTCGADRCAVGFAALRRAIAVVRATGAVYVLANVPEHVRRWQGPDAADRYRAYLEALRAFAESEGVAFVDPTNGNVAAFKDAPYSDFSHMTPQGCRQYTAALADGAGALIATTLGRGEDQLVAAF